jgi:hypothetical protein
MKIESIQLLKNQISQNRFHTSKINSDRYGTYTISTIIRTRYTQSFYAKERMQ